MKLSFSLTSSSKSSSSRPLPVGNLTAVGGGEEEGHAAASSKSEFVTVFDPTVTLATDAGPAPSLAPLSNTHTWRAPKRMKNLLPPPTDADSSSSAVTSRFELDTSQPKGGGGESYGLTLRSKGGGGDVRGGGDVVVDLDQGVPGGRSELTVKPEQRFWGDIVKLPEDRGFHEFQDVSVEDFGRALLAGYGWKDGQGIGRNKEEDTKVMEYQRWTNRGGLGFKTETGTAVEKGRKKGREELPPVPPPAKSNRTSANESSTVDGDKSKIVRVIAGEHAGMKAELLRRPSHSGHGMVVLSLLRSRAEVRIGADMVAELGSAEEQRCLRKLKEVEIREVDERKDEKKRDGRKYGRRKHKSSSTAEGGRSGSHDGERESSERHQSSNGREGEPVSWLRSHIRVRIISKDFKGGKLYLKKGEVMDVIGPMTCDLSVDESGEFLQGVDQGILETALPRRGGPVLVLFGRHKGRFGNLMEKDIENATAVIQDADNHELLNVRLEQIAEYVGDPSVLGY